MNRLPIVCLVALALWFPAVAQTPPPSSGNREIEPKPNPEAQKQAMADAGTPLPGGGVAPAMAADGGCPCPAGGADAGTPWEVDKPSGPSTQVRIDVTEGTWMDVDVSPDGKELAFDLLGDLYLLPIGGGEARPLTSGLAWDMQPRFSPDGKSIAFTSDRGGGDNLWVIGRDGQKPRQVTKEAYRLVNEPAWSPDGQFLVGRKHFTSRRSIGAGEMWLYHAFAGGEGVQLTERRTEQKDVGEPAFSPDGRYVYYSEDVTPGKVFEYNKDPNGEIYAINRLDRDIGEIEPFVTGPGGSIRPTPSPDGKSLAFIRRIRLKSVLMIADVQSGAERTLYDGLDRDMQETWAIHGVYPTIAWTPDSKSLVFWAGGKLHRIEVATKKVTPIPFHVKATRTVVDALRFPQSVLPPEFEVKMLRWARVSPRGNQVVYQALGKLYLRDLPNGTPRRLTRQNDHSEFYPAWTRDGASIVYTTWDDEKLGSIRLAPARGGEGKVLTSRPGHYLEPAISPDGKWLVYRTTGDGTFLPGAWGRERGLYAVPVAGGTPRRISKEGFDPHFGAESDRFYFLAIEGSEKEEKRHLKSLRVDGSEPRTVVTSAEAQDFEISPDGKWLAFQQHYNVFVMPTPRGAKTASAGPDAKGMPTSRVSKDAGNFLHWSGDSRRLHWSLGSELFTRELKDAFTFLPGSPEKVPEAPAKGTNITFRVKSDLAKGTIALVGARLVTMKGDEVIEDGAILVRDGRIAAIGPRAQVQIPGGTQTIDVKGSTIIPGLIDVHWHGPMGNDGLLPEQSWVNHGALAFGVTTIHDPSNDTAEIFAASELQRSGLSVGPHIFSTGTILYGASGAFRAPIETLEDARNHLRRMKAVGAFTVKSYNQPRRDQRQKVIQAARELEMMVVPEGGSLFQHNMSMIADGHTGIEHAIPVAKIYDDVRQFWSQTQVGYTPTLIVAYGGIWGENYWYQHSKVWENERLLAFTPRRNVDARSRRRMMANEDDFNHRDAAKIAADLAKLGVLVNTGAHGQRESLGEHWELWMMGQGGLAPLEALRTATINGARYLGLDKDVGSLEVGKLADLVVLTRNPLEDLRNSEAIRYTMVSGRLYDAATMNELGLRQKARAKFFFELDGNQGFSPGKKLTVHED